MQANYTVKSHDYLQKKAIINEFLRKLYKKLAESIIVILKRHLS